MMLAWSPPLVMMPCPRARGLVCGRIRSSETKSWIMALSALTPRQGQDEACEALPKNSHLTLMMPRLGRHTCVPQRPWIIMAASTSLKTPASMSLTLPAPPSSAGVPITWMRPAKGTLPSAAPLAPPAPRGRRADPRDAPREGHLAERRRDGRTRAGPRGGDHVVPAGVPDVGQGVVLRQDRNGRPRPAALYGRSEGCRQPAHAPLDLGAMLLEDLAEPPRRLLFLETELRVAVDLEGDLLEVVGQAGHRLHDLGLRLVERLSIHA